MLKSKICRLIAFSLIVALSVTLVFVGCKSGNTEGGEAISNDAGVGTQFVSDGAAGGSLSIKVNGNLTVTGTVTFSVTAKDANGNPVPFIRIFCESEQGIAIIEPSSGGVAFEHTSSNGTMSGVLGGLLPGSYIMECRGPQGFNLLARAPITIRGDVPEGFAGFPGSAGGNLGGGAVVDNSPSDSVVITAIDFDDAGTGDILDTVRTADCDAVTAGNQPEPFEFAKFRVTIRNGSNSKVFINSIRMDISEGSNTGTQSVVAEIDAGGSTTVTGVLATDPSNDGINYAGSNAFAIVAGTFSGTATVSFTDSAGNSFTTTDTTSLFWDIVDNCPTS